MDAFAISKETRRIICLKLLIVFEEVGLKQVQLHASFAERVGNDVDLPGMLLH